MSISSFEHGARLEASEHADDPAPPVAERLRLGQVDDWEFDEVYPPPVRMVSSTFWTPVNVAVRAAELLVVDTPRRVLDVGSGVGKFCIVGAAVTGASFTGVEQREHLVQIARTAAARFGVQEASFVHAAFEAVNVEDFDAIYFFNPFQENLFSSDCRLDETVELCRARFAADVERAESLLRRAAIGTRVVTYHGFGGDMPASYRRLRRERRRTGHLELWIKDAPSESP